MASPLNPNISALTDSLSQSFSQARPFPHVVADNFLAPEFAQKLFAQFPPFAQERAIAEHGKVGGKATRENMRELGSAFQELDEFFASADFLGWMSQLTGIPDLLYDPEYFGGGTHENLPGQDMSVHVDFNYHPTRGWHRRLNVLIYLNPEWEESWGGSLELWQNPWDAPNKNSIAKITPRWNRMVAFPTTEHSWHGFETVKIPEYARNRVPSRRSIALYLYSKDRPAAEMGTMHSTVYYERPLPESIRAEKVISRADWNEMTRLIARRDDLLKMIYAREGRFNGLIAELEKKNREQEHALRIAGGSLSSASASVPLEIVKEQQETIHQLMTLVTQLANSPTSTSPLLFLPSVSDVHTACSGFWRLKMLSAGVKVKVLQKFQLRPKIWALVKLRDSDRLQLVYLAQEFQNFFLAHQATSPGTLLIPHRAVYGQVVELRNQMGERIFLPNELRTRFYSLALAWLFVLVHVAKNILFRRVRSPWLWRASVLYRRALKTLGIHVPVVPPPSGL